MSYIASDCPLTKFRSACFLWQIEIFVVVLVIAAATGKYSWPTYGMTQKITTTDSYFVNKKTVLTNCQNYSVDSAITLFIK